VQVEIGDVVAIIRDSPAAFDSVKLDVDNGPDALTAASNASLYDDHGIAAIRRSLRPGGTLAVWAIRDDVRFERRLPSAGFTLQRRHVPSRPTRRRGLKHTILLAYVRGGRFRLDVSDPAWRARPRRQRAMADSNAVRHRRGQLRQASARANARAKPTLRLLDGPGAAQPGDRSNMASPANDRGPAMVDLEVKNARVVFTPIWQRLENELGREHLRFPKEMILLGGAPGAGKGTQTQFINEARGLTCPPIVISELLTTPEMEKLKARGLMVGDTEVLDILLRTDFTVDDFHCARQRSFARCRRESAAGLQAHPRMLPYARKDRR
jgi:hypothetical protein